MRVSEIVAILRSDGWEETDGTRHRIFRKNGEMLTLPRAQHDGGSAPWVVDSLKSALRRANRGIRQSRAIRAHEIELRRSVKARIDFIGVARGTLGRIVADYGSGFIVEWFIPELRTPLRDGFDKARELMFLEAA